MRRSINEKMFLRLAAQADEARLLKMEKLSNNLDIQVQEYAERRVRQDEAKYSYSHEQMRADIEKSLWAAAIRAADYYGAPFDAVKAQKTIDKIAEDLIEEVRVIVGSESGVGPYDVKVPGEISEEVLFEIEVSDD